MTARIGCMGCGTFEGQIAHRADLPDKAMLCDRCARLHRRGRRLSRVLGVEVEVNTKESDVEVDGYTYVTDESRPGDPRVRDDGPTNAFWAGPGPMPDALRRAGLIDPHEDDDDDQQG